MMSGISPFPWIRVDSCTRNIFGGGIFDVSMNLKICGVWDHGCINECIHGARDTVA